MIAISAIAMIGALGLIAYPTFSDWWNRMHQSYAVAGYVEQTKDMSGAERKAMLKAAHEYNERLAANGDRWHMTDAQKREYDETLDVTGTGIMGYVTIPRIKVKLPVYHGTSDGVLQIAAGHLAGTSLPVGGATTHAVVSGHTHQQSDGDQHHDSARRFVQPCRVVAEQPIRFSPIAAHLAAHSRFLSAYFHARY